MLPLHTFVRSEGCLIIGLVHFLWMLAGECIPIRLFLSSIDLTPTYRGVNNRFSVRYYLNLVLVDEEDRRYANRFYISFYKERSSKFTRG